MDAVTNIRKERNCDGVERAIKVLTLKQRNYRALLLFFLLLYTLVYPHLVVMNDTQAPPSFKITTITQLHGGGSLSRIHKLGERQPS